MIINTFALYEFNYVIGITLLEIPGLAQTYIPLARNDTFRSSFEHDIELDATLISLHVVKAVIPVPH